MSLNYVSLQEAMTNMKVSSIHENATEQKQIIQGRIRDQHEKARKRLKDRLNRQQSRNNKSSVSNEQAKKNIYTQQKKEQNSNGQS